MIATRMPRLGFAALLLLLGAADVAGQKNCRKGIPCGNTCIAADKVCRIGGGASSAAPLVEPQAVTVPEGAQYVASSAGRVYYWSGCGAWKRLSRANLRFFATPEEARAAGYEASRSRGCAGPDSGLVAPLVTAPPADPTVPLAGTCRIRSITDGDTVRCADGERIRLLLIDSPEMDQGPFGIAARQALVQLLPVGTDVGVELDVQQRDRYGRVLVYLYTPDRRLVNEEMALNGYALVSVYPPNVRHVERIRAAAEDARKAGRGLWGTQAFECPPGEHRRGRC